MGSLAFLKTLAHTGAGTAGRDLIAMPFQRINVGAALAAHGRMNSPLHYFIYQWNESRWDWSGKACRPPLLPLDFIGNPLRDPAIATFMLFSA